MMPDFGKLLFPRLQRNQRRHEMRVLSAAILVGLAVGGIIVFLMIIKEKAGKF
jgi:hypothetical protein